METQQLVIWIICWIAFGLICRSMAGKRGRNKDLGLALGVLFGLFSVIGYAIAGNTEEQKLINAKKLCDKYNFK